VAIIKKTDFQVVKISYYNMMMSLPIMVIRKIKALWLPQGDAHSDLSIELPFLVNKALTYIYRAEIALLGFLSYPFGVSLVAVLQKPNLKEPRW
jgi:hypothetical protein